MTAIETAPETGLRKGTIGESVPRKEDRRLLQGQGDRCQGGRRQERVGMQEQKAGAGCGGGPEIQLDRALAALRPLHTAPQPFSDAGRVVVAPAIDHQNLVRFGVLPHGGDGALEMGTFIPGRDDDGDRHE